MWNVPWGEELQADEVVLSLASSPSGLDVLDADHHVLHRGPRLQPDRMHRIGRQRPWRFNQRTAGAQVDERQLVEARDRAAQSSDDLEPWLASPVTHCTTHPGRRRAAGPEFFARRRIHERHSNEPAKLACPL